MKLLALLFVLVCQSALSADLKIEQNEILKTIIQEMKAPGSTPEIYPVTEKYRLDLTLKDLIDQTTIIAEDIKGANERLAFALNTDGKNINFLKWLEEVKELADENKDLLNDLDKSLYLQFYNTAGVALLPEYKLIDFKKIKDNGKLSRMHDYNKIATDPEAQGLRMAFELESRAPFITSDLTVAKLKKVKFKVLRTLRGVYYAKLAELYHAQDPQTDYVYRSGKFRPEVDTGSADHKTKKLFKIIQGLSNKHQVLLYLATEVPGMPYVNSMHLFTLDYIGKNLDALLENLKEFTLSQIIRSTDDEYILHLRKYMEKNISTIETDLKDYNEKNKTDLSIIYKNREKKPGRVEAIVAQDTLLKLYPNAPWMTGKHGVVFNKDGKEIYFDKNMFTTIGRFFSKLGHELIQTETYLSILAGTATLIITDGNLPVAMGTQKLVKDAVETARYDHEWNEFLKEAPQDVVNSFLLWSGAGVGRFYKIIALGAGQGMIQSYFTGQDLRTGALVGAGLNIIQFYLLPSNIGRPMTKGFDAKSLAMNRRLETLEKVVKGTIQGATVAAIEGDPILKGSIKGLLYGYISAKLLIWFVGTRYYAFKDFNSADVDDMIKLENDFQNEVGRGGTYAINRQLILDANYRVGGVLPDMISASITLPGNVAMGDQGFTKLTTLTHEAHHLMQQSQSGVFGFYLFRYIPTGLVTGYNGHPDENFLKSVVGYR